MAGSYFAVPSGIVILPILLSLLFTAIGPERATVTAVAAGENGRVLAGTAEGLLYEQIDGRWVQRDSTAGATPISQIVLAPSELVINSGALFKNGERIATPEDVRAVSAANGVIWFLGPSDTVYRSTDGGRTWFNSWGWAGLVNVYAHPTRPGVAFAVTASGVGFRTTDNGATWKQLVFLPSKIVFDGNRMYFVDNLGRISRSDDDGETIQILYADVPVLSIAARDGHVYAGLVGEGVLQSTDGGDTFFHVYDGFRDAAEISSTATSSDERVLYAGTPTSMFKSEDGGASWQTMFVIRQLRGPFSHVEIDQNDSRHVWIAASKSIWKTRDNGGNFNHQFDLPGDVIGISILSTEKVWFATPLMVALYTGRDYAYENRSPQLSPTRDFLSALFVEPSGVVWVAGRGVFHSSDDGATWSQRTEVDQQVTALLVRNGIVFAGGERLLRSDDNGATFRTVVAFDSPINDLAFVDGTYYAATDGGLYASETGDSWRRVLVTEVPVTSLAGTRNVYAGTFGRGLLRSDDEVIGKRRGVRR